MVDVLLDCKEIHLFDQMFCSRASLRWCKRTKSGVRRVAIMVVCDVCFMLRGTGLVCFFVFFEGGGPRFSFFLWMSSCISRLSRTALRSVPSLQENAIMSVHQSGELFKQWQSKYSLCAFLAVGTAGMILRGMTCARATMLGI